MTNIAVDSEDRMDAHFIYLSKKLFSFIRQKNIIVREKQMQIVTFTKNIKFCFCLFRYFSHISKAST